MTAVATIVATQREGVLLVPNTALRFSPTAAAATGAASGSSILSKMMPRPPSSSAKKVSSEAQAQGARQIWVLQDGQAQSLNVTAGISDGRSTEVSGESLREGMAVITDQRSSAAAP
jgi:HlyD family secretion protein